MYRHHPSLNPLTVRSLSAWNSDESPKKPRNCCLVSFFSFNHSSQLELSVIWKDMLGTNPMNFPQLLWGRRSIEQTARRTSNWVIYTAGRRHNIQKFGMMTTPALSSHVSLHNSACHWNKLDSSAFTSSGWVCTHRYGRGYRHCFFLNRDPIARHHRKYFLSSAHTWGILNWLCWVWTVGSFSLLVCSQIPRHL